MRPVRLSIALLALIAAPGFAGEGDEDAPPPPAASPSTPGPAAGAPSELRGLLIGSDATLRRWPSGEILAQAPNVPVGAIPIAPTPPPAAPATAISTEVVRQIADAAASAAVDRALHSAPSMQAPTQAAMAPASTSVMAAYRRAGPIRRTVGLAGRVVGRVGDAIETVGHDRILIPTSAAAVTVQPVVVNVPVANTAPSAAALAPVEPSLQSPRPFLQGLLRR